MALRYSTDEFVSARSSSRSTCTTSEKQQLILDARTSAVRMACKLLRRWNAWLERSELESVVDMALCEAAHRYTPHQSAKFSTYAFYFIKGALLDTLKFNDLMEPVGDEEIGAFANGGASEGDWSEDQQGASHYDSTVACGERSMVLHMFRKDYDEALEALNDLERKVVVAHDMMGDSITGIAEDMGYSRGHLSFVYSTASKKMRAALNDWKEAA